MRWAWWLFVERSSCGFEIGRGERRWLGGSASQRRKNRSDMTGKINGWKTILNTLTVHYGDRIAASSIN